MYHVTNIDLFLDYLSFSFFPDIKLFFFQSSHFTMHPVKRTTCIYGENCNIEIAQIDLLKMAKDT